MLLASSEGYGKTYISSLAFVFSWFVHSRAVLFWKILSMIHFYDFSIHLSYLLSIDLSISRIKSFYLILHLLCFLYKIFICSVLKCSRKLRFLIFLMLYIDTFELMLFRAKNHKFLGTCFLVCGYFFNWPCFCLVDENGLICRAEI